MVAAALLLLLAQTPDPAHLNGPIFSSPARARRALKQQETFNFGPLAGSSYVRPSFAGDSDLTYLFYVKSDCSVACVTDDVGTTCPGIAWSGGTGATCRQIWTGDWALTDVSDAKCWKFSNMTRTPSTFFESDFSVSIFHTATSKYSAFGMLMQMYSTNDGFYMRNESGTIHATWFETGVNPAAIAVQSSYDGFSLATIHRLGSHHNININGGSENSDIVSSNAMTPAGTITGGIGCDDTGAGKALGGQWVWAALYKANKTPATSSNVALAAAGFPVSSTISPQTQSTTVCLDPTDAGQAECLVNGLPIVTEQGFRAWSGERTTSKAAADTLDVSSLTDVNSPAVATNVKAGPFFEVKHSNEMDRLVDNDGTHFAGKKTNASSFIRAPMNYTSCIYASVGDGGVSNKLHMTLEVAHGLFADGGTEVDCDYSALGDVPALESCTGLLASYDGGVDLRAGYYCGGVASDSCSVTLGQFRVNAGVTCEPATLSNGTVGDNYLLVDATSWKSDVRGGAHEIVWKPLSTGGSASSTTSPYGDWAEQGDAIYLHDGYDDAGTPNHDVTYLPNGYNTAGHVLFRFANSSGGLTDLTMDSLNLSARSMYATRAQWIPAGGGNCALSAKWTTCNGTVSSCIATVTQISGSGPCPDQPLHVKVGQRYDSSVPTDAWILSIRHLTP